MNAFVVTTSVSGSSRTQIWDPTRPLALGHPLQWVIERTSAGVRVRNLGRPSQKIEAGLKEVPDSALEKGAEIQLTGSELRAPISIRIRPVVEQAPAWTGAQGDTLTLYSCAGNWVSGSKVIVDGFTAMQGEKKVFTLRKSGTGIRVESASGELTVARGEGQASALAAGQSLELSATDAVNTVLSAGPLSWRFALSAQPAVPVSKNASNDEDSTAFLLALRYTALGLGAFIALSWFWPESKPETQELVPPQFTKLVMSKPKEVSKSAPSAASQASQVAASAPKKVQDSAVVQAFRAKALSNAVSGLLKGGMTRLMAQSDFVAGSGSEARRLFDAKSKSLTTTGVDAGSLTNKNTQVAALGGAGAVGYGKGEHAGVKGQGNAFVSMDTGGSSVEEGLTKDEVGEVIHRHLSEVRYCYESAMLRTPDIEGKLITNFVIGGNGMVKSTEVKSSTLPDPRLDDCILRRLVTWKFPNPRGGVDVAVSYPFIFKTLGR